MALLPQQSDKIGGGLIYLSKEQKREVFFFFTRQTQHKSLDVIEAWAAEAVPVFFLL